MAYDATKPFDYGIADGTYTGKPTTASLYEKDNRLILDIRFAVKDPHSGEWYKNDKGYDWEVMKRHWLTSKEGGFNEATINGLKEWAKGWNPATIEDFYWFQRPDANGTPFGNLAAVGEVELNFQRDKTGAQQLWVHDPNRPKTGGRTAFVPDGGNADAAALTAKWGAKAKALFAATPKKVAVQAAPTATPKPVGGVPAPARAATPPAAPTRPAAPVRPVAAAPADRTPWADFPQTADGAFAYFCSKLGEPYSSEKHDGKWFEIYDGAAQGKDPDQFGPDDVQRLFNAVETADMPF